MLKDLKIKNAEDIKELIKEYNEKEKYHTFRGFLVWCGITSEEMNEIMVGKFAEEDNPKLTKKYTKMYKVLELYKNKLEAKLEEYLLYQERHEDLKGCENINYKNFEFLLKASNRSVYDSAKTNTNAPILNVKQEENKLPTNTSEVKLWVAK